jgi:hypothetical protein
MTKHEIYNHVPGVIRTRTRNKRMAAVPHLTSAVSYVQYITLLCPAITPCSELRTQRVEKRKVKMARFFELRKRR